MSGMSFKSDDPNWDNSWNLPDVPPPMPKYKVAEASSKEDLESQVNILLAEGYECQGSICTSSTFVSERPKGDDCYWFTPYIRTIYSQAMIKKDVKC